MELSKNVFSFRKLIVVMAILTFLSACRSLPPSAPKELADATYSLHKNLDENFAHTIELMEERAYLRYTDTTIARINYTDPVAVQLKQQFDRRLRYINVVAAYFSTLAALAEKNNTQEVHDAACKLDASLSGLKEKVAVPEQELYKNASIGFTFIIDFILRSATERFKQKTIIMAMDSAGPSLDTICKMLEQELLIAEMMVTNNENSVILRLITTRNTDSSLTNRVAWDRSILVRMKELERMHASYKSAIALVRSLPAAHAQARSLLNKKAKVRDAIAYVSAQGTELGVLYSKIKSSQ